VRTRTLAKKWAALFSYNFDTSIFLALIFSNHVLIPH
jgi:hypothetical protein